MDSLLRIRVLNEICDEMKRGGIRDIKRKGGWWRRDYGVLIEYLIWVMEMTFCWYFYVFLV